MAGAGRLAAGNTMIDNSATRIASRGGSSTAAGASEQARRSPSQPAGGSAADHNESGIERCK